MASHFYYQKAKEAGTGGGVELTGNLGDVMKESIKIGGTFARLQKIQKMASMFKI